MVALLEREDTNIRIETPEPTEAPTVHTPLNTPDGRPDPKWVRGRCPECGEELVSNMYYIGGKGYLLVWECWSSLGEQPQCCYRRVL
jgi:hypothetical protein